MSQTNQTWYHSTNDNALTWKSGALVIGICGVLGLFDIQEPVACASNKDKDEDFMEKAKKMVQEFSTSAITQVVSLFPNDDKNVKKKINTFVASGTGGQISWGICMGICAGFALKKMSKLGVVSIGALFVMLQCANYSGYVDVDYKKLKRDLKDCLDINEEIILDTRDLDSLYRSIMKTLQASLPTGYGFAAGVIAGFRLG
ncbi:unnamed protein product [Peronospora belbahrii]|uniref:FUN14 family protein n=1 Tax=Peronospora belbahrii TaxID=622444 RepID=A0ABN8CTK8_9STRA|nr:unnamed protein product [Peronospora belbahrii]